MGCFLTVTKNDFDQIKRMRGVNRRSGGSGQNVRIEIGNKSWSRGEKSKLANRVRQTIARNQSNRTTSPAKQIKKTTNNFIANSKNGNSLKAIPFSSFKGLVSRNLGKASEGVAARILEETQNLKILEITEGRGPDIEAKSVSGSSVMIEVKSTLFTDRKTKFSNMLKPAYGHQQCSDEWFKACNVDPTKVSNVLGVHINVPNYTYSIYQRVDSKAENWEPLVENAPLKPEYFGN